VLSTAAQYFCQETATVADQDHVKLRDRVRKQLQIATFQKLDA